MIFRYFKVTFVAAALAIVAAGGVSVLDSSEASAAGTSAARTCGGGTIQLNFEEKRTLELHNRTRVDRGLRALCVSPILTKAARAHSSEMIQKHYFSHNSANGESFSSRLKRYGYTPNGYRSWTVGENIAGGHASPEATMNAWMNSSGHRSNILASKFREVGIGVVKGSHEGRADYPMYTVDFGARIK